jgi:hypothetical protein
MGPQKPLSYGEAKALCLILATKSTNGIDGSASTNPSVDTGYGVYTRASGTPKLGDQSVSGRATASVGSGISNNITYFGTMGGCMNSLGFHSLY